MNNEELLKFLHALFPEQKQVFETYNASPSAEKLKELQTILKKRQRDAGLLLKQYVKDQTEFDDMALLWDQANDSIEALARKIVEKLSMRRVNEPHHYTLDILQVLSKTLIDLIQEKEQSAHLQQLKTKKYIKEEVFLAADFVIEPKKHPDIFVVNINGNAFRKTGLHLVKFDEQKQRYVTIANPIKDKTYWRFGVSAAQGLGFSPYILYPAWESHVATDPLDYDVGPIDSFADAIFEVTLLQPNANVDSIVRKRTRRQVQEPPAKRRAITTTRAQYYQFPVMRHEEWLEPITEEKEEESADKPLYEHTVSFTVDTHMPVDQVLQYLNLRLGLGNERLFSYDSIRKRVILNPISQIEGILFKSRLAILLGFEADKVYNTSMRHIAEVDVNLRGGVNYIFVYMPVLDGEQVGSERLPLLRIIPFDTRNPEVHQLNYIFQRPYYCKLSRSSLDSLQVITRDQLGREILFKSGKIVLTLHLRLRR